MDGVSAQLEQNIKFALGALRAQERLKLMRKLTPALVFEPENVILNTIYAVNSTVMQEVGELDFAPLSLQAAFFQNIHEFVIPIELSRKVPARISVDSLERIWAWIIRDLLADNASAYAAQFLEAQLNADDIQVENIVTKCRTHFIESATEYLKDVDKNEIAFNKFKMQIGSEYAVQDIKDIVFIFGRLDFINEIKLFYIGHNTIDDLIVSTIRKKISAVSDNFDFLVAICAQLQKNFNYKNSDFLRFLFSIKTSLVPSATLVNNQFLPFLDILISDQEIHLEVLKKIIKSDPDADEFLQQFRQYHSIARSLMCEIEFQKTDVIGARYMHVRDQMNLILKSEIDDLIPSLNRLMRQFKQLDTNNGKEIESDMVDALERMFKIYDGARIMSGELALNDYFNTMKKNIETLFKNQIEQILDSVNNISSDAEIFRIKTEIIMRFIPMIFSLEFVEQVNSNFKMQLQKRVAHAEVA